MLARWVALCCLVFVGSLVGVAILRVICVRRGWLVQPREDRWHRHATAVHGGIGFFPPFLLGFLAIIVAKFEVTDASMSTVPVELGLALALLLGGILMFVLGFLDDLRSFSPVVKIVGQTLAATVFVVAGGVLPLTGQPVVDALVTYLWIIGITNAFNLLDNMDGLSVGIGILSATVVGILSFGSGDAGPISTETSLAGLVCPVLAAALLGFWIHNKPPARIFMGDSGSQFIGFTLATLAIPGPLNGYLGLLNDGVSSANAASGDAAAAHIGYFVLVPATILSVPIFDTCLVAITRYLRRQKFWHGGRDHTSHRLVVLGLSEKTAVFLLCGLSLVGGTIAILMQQFLLSALPIFGVYVSILLVTGVYLSGVQAE
jgi:UDP-GlcNAc:undecaprenyl-phosphate GlcNAc-1-phosphate transferase